MLIIEGPDGVGKTTAANALCGTFSEHFGGEPREYYAHMTRPEPSFDHVQGYMDMVRCGVQDRFHLGCITYGKILGSGGHATAREMLVVQRYLEWQGCLTVILYSSSRDWLRKHLVKMASRKEMYALDQILDVNTVYDALSSSSNRGEPYASYSWDVSVRGFPAEKNLNFWFQRWLERWQS